MYVLYESTFTDFVADVQSTDKRIVGYGAGLIAVAILDIFSNAGICGNLSRFVDRDPGKYGGSIITGTGKIPICESAELGRLDLANSLLLITCEDFASAITSLDACAEFDDLRCYIYPLLNRSYIADLAAAVRSGGDDIPTGDGVQRIPKVLHYCWFGGSRMSDFLENCLRSWREYNPEYEIVLWNEDNYDVYKNNYTRQAHAGGKFAFVADYARLDILHQYGGVYMDADVKIMKSFDRLLTNNAFMSYDQWPMPNSAIMGSVPGLEMVKEMLDNPRGHMDFLMSDGSANLTTNSVYEWSLLRNYGFRRDFSLQTIRDITIYPPWFFASGGRCGLNIEPDAGTYALHYCLESWADDETNGMTGY
jgi:hypothetical protein